MQIFVITLCGCKKTLFTDVVRLPLEIRTFLKLAKDEAHARAEAHRLVDEHFPPGSEFNRVTLRVDPVVSEEVIKAGEFLKSLGEDSTEVLNAEIITD